MLCKLVQYTCAFSRWKMTSVNKAMREQFSLQLSLWRRQPQGRHDMDRQCIPGALWLFGKISCARQKQTHQLEQQVKPLTLTIISIRKPQGRQTVWYVRRLSVNYTRSANWWPVMHTVSCHLHCLPCIIFIFVYHIHRFRTFADVYAPNTVSVVEP